MYLIKHKNNKYININETPMCLLYMTDYNVKKKIHLKILQR